MSKNETYKLSKRAISWSIAFIVLGLLGTAIALLAFPENHHSRFWSNLLLNIYYFTGIAIFGVFFSAAHQVGRGGWQSQIKRIMESFSAFLPYLLLAMIAIIVGMWLVYTSHGEIMIHNLYEHWLHPHGEIDAKFIHTEKSFLLNMPLFTGSIIGFYILWIILSRRMIRLGAQEDKQGTVSQVKALLSKRKVASVAYLFVFAISSSVASWLMNMSLDPHWYSTLFGWYNLAGYGCASIAFMILFVIYFKSKGFLPYVNQNHIHDLGKYLFGFSVFWTYLWFASFLLIWYGNIPEDTQWFFKRFEEPLFNVLFYLVLAINFFLPLLVLMRRGSKRSLPLMVVVSILVIGGHYLDFYSMIMYEPNAISHYDVHDNGHSIEKEGESHEVVKLEETYEEDANKDDTHNQVYTTYARIGFVELFMFLGFLGAFILTAFKALSKRPIVPKNNPFVKESMKHHI